MSRKAILIIGKFLSLGLFAATPTDVFADEQPRTQPGEMKPYTVKFESTGVQFDMIPIPAGEFLMGSPDNEPGRKPDEGPQVRVKLEAFWMGKCEVTWDEFVCWSEDLDIAVRLRKKLQATQLDFEADVVTRPTLPYTDMSFEMGKAGGFPAINMSQHMAKTYCEWLSKKTGHYYRLPTEAEWEYACRAGTKTAYSFGDDPSLIGDFAWFKGNCGPKDKPAEDIDDQKYRKVGQKMPNPWGLYDMHGNVSEWCLDKYEADLYLRLKKIEPVTWPYQIPAKTYGRVVRGGGFNDSPEKLRSASRIASNRDWNENDPDSPQSVWYLTNAESVGFRVVRPLKTPTELEYQQQKLGPVLPEDAEYNNRRVDRREQIRWIYESYQKPKRE